MPIQAPEKSVALKNIEEAHENNKKIIEHDSLVKTKKYNNYDKFVLNQSEMFLNELENLENKKNQIKETKNYEQYKRGRIVYVNFGINIGEELSGWHYAIVLNNDDYGKNSLLTVVPLSSKNNPKYIDLGDELWSEIIFNIFSKINNRFTNEDIDNFNNIQFKLSELMRNQDIDNDKKDLFNSMYEIMKSNNDDTSAENSGLNEQYFRGKINHFLDLMEEEKESIEKFNLACDEIHEKLVNNHTEEEIKEILAIQSDNPTIRLFKIMVELAWDKNKLEIYKEIAKEFDRMARKLLKYRNLDNNTYAIVNQITTISKNKIYKVYNHPLKYAYVSDDALDLIDNAIRGKYLKKMKSK